MCIGMLARVWMSLRNMVADSAGRPTTREIVEYYCPATATARSTQGREVCWKICQRVAAVLLEPSHSYGSTDSTQKGENEKEQHTGLVG